MNNMLNIVTEIKTTSDWLNSNLSMTKETISKFEKRSIEFTKPIGKDTGNGEGEGGVAKSCMPVDNFKRCSIYSIEYQKRKTECLKNDIQEPFKINDSQ